MSYKIAGIDIHKRMVAVVVADVAGEGEYQFERHKFGSGGEQLRLLAEWLVANQIEEVVMESTAQYWKPVWGALERDGSRSAGQEGLERSPDGFCWPKRSPIARPADARTTLPMPNAC